MGSGRETIEPGDKAHKRADSGVVVGKGARLGSRVEGLWLEDKQVAFITCSSGIEGCLRMGGVAGGVGL